MSYLARSRNLIVSAAEILKAIGEEEDSAADMTGQPRCVAGEGKIHHCPYPVKHKGLCEGHYRRSLRVSGQPWDGPLLRRKPRSDKNPMVD